MKVHCQYGVRGLSGTIDNSVFYYSRRVKKSLMRKYVVPDNEANTNRTKIIMANLQRIQPSEDYRIDFHHYWIEYEKLREFEHKRVATWYNLYIKMMFAMQKTDSRVNLQTLTREQIYEQDLPCKNVCNAIEAGLLPPVTDYNWLKKEI
jgi:hypothetical protein